MIRGYAKLLEIDPELVLKSLDRRNIPGEISVDLRAKRVPFPDGVKRPGTQMYLALSVIALSAVLVVLYEWHTGALSFPLDSDKREVAARKSQLAQKSEVSTPPASADPVTPTLVVVETPLPSAPSPSVETMPVKDIKRLQVEGRIFLEFEDESWVEIKDSDGKTLMAQLNPSGSRRLIAGQPPFSLVIGNAAAVRVVYNDAPVDLRPYVKVEVARLTLK
jgi:cytoskeleton protein RodZ